MRRFLSPMTRRHHDATVRQHQAHDPHQSLTIASARTRASTSTTGHHFGRHHRRTAVPVTFR